MSMGLIIERRGNACERITVEEWEKVISGQPDMRIRKEPYFAVNPRTLEKIVFPCGEADAEILVNGEWLPFLRFEQGSLVTEYQDEFEDPANEIRIAIVHIAEALRAVVGTDFSDELVDWSIS
jgi:hypothetical protein